MPWSTPPDFTAGAIVTETQLDTLSSDLTFFLSGFAVSYLCYEAGADYTTTSTSFADVDATNLKLTMTVKGGRAIIFASCSLRADNTASSGAEITIIADSLTYPTAGTHGLCRVAQNATAHPGIVAVFTGLSDGSHTFKLQFRNVQSGATATIGKASNTAATAGSPITMAGIAW